MKLFKADREKYATRSEIKWDQFLQEASWDDLISRNHELDAQKQGIRQKQLQIQQELTRRDEVRQSELDPGQVIGG